ncbi:MAG: hypothetical protein OZ926_14660 [Pseudomonas sp.]|nr:hypothetical protein [Pseudomonas sp.]
MKIYCNRNEPERTGLTWAETWQGPDRGLIRSWEIGRNTAGTDPELAARCRAGELPPLGWKGGGTRTLKKGTRYGSLQYLATWQGLRGEALSIDMDKERTIECTRTDMLVTFTPDQTLLAGQGNDNDEEGVSDGPASGIREQSLFSSSAD